MQEKVVFKLDVFDERIKQRAMKVKLKKIYKYVDIIALEHDGEPKKNPDPAKKPEPIVKKAPSFRRWKISFF
ncbi:hypothetical protein Bca52824_043662 [Brassica carinata]|uniref:Uncharacterized protein n=1 Tax=Brassica carinata TaxID=52824 RepID=A0A8X7RWX8_BRACI|nr:hypothetical protein Bca52824_043662 [Brassica carinata]